MKKITAFFFGLNYRQGIPALMILIAVGVKVYHDVTTKDLDSFFADWQALSLDVAGIALAFGIGNAKAKQLTGGSGNSPIDTTK